MDLLKKTSSTDALIHRVRFSNLTTYLPLRPGEIRVAVISDVHLYHSRVKTVKIIGEIDREFPDERLETLTHIVISGDLFERRLPFDSDDGFKITRWMGRFARKLKKYGVTLLILEGTPSHDHRQSQWFVLLNELAHIGADIRYYDSLTIDTLYEGGPTVLYVPDELNHDANKTWKQVNELMRLKGLTKVDFAVMHGMFTFQEPIRTVVSHTEERYEDIVNHRILIGHHHTPVACGKIRVPGSFERLRHNEEEDKGHFQFSLLDGEIVDETFIINDAATLFTTLDVVGRTFVEVLDTLKSCDLFPAGSFVRLKLSRRDAAYVSFRQLKDDFPHLNLTHKTVDTDDHVSEGDDLIERPTVTAIRPDTLPDLLRPRFVGAGSEVMAAIERIMLTA